MGRTWLDGLEMNTVIVHTVNNGPSFKGIRRAVYDDGLVLHQAMMLEETGSVVIDGDYFIPRAQVLGIQLLAGDVA